MLGDSDCGAFHESDQDYGNREKNREIVGVAYETAFKFRNHGHSGSSTPNYLTIAAKYRLSMTRRSSVAGLFCSRALSLSSLAELRYAAAVARTRRASL